MPERLRDLSVAAPGDEQLQHCVFAGTGFAPRLYGLQRPDHGWGRNTLPEYIDQHLVRHALDQVAAPPASSAW